MAARDTGMGAVEQFMHQGKLLALDLLTHVFNDPGHNWTLSRPLVRAASCRIVAHQMKCSSQFSLLQSLCDMCCHVAATAPFSAPCCGQLHTVLFYILCDTCCHAATTAPSPTTCSLEQSWACHSMARLGIDQMCRARIMYSHL